jgi:hypothetical protein
LIFSASAISAIARNFPASSIRFYRCALTSARINADTVPPPWNGALCSMRMAARLVMKCHVVKQQSGVAQSERPTALDRVDPVLKGAVTRVVFGMGADKRQTALRTLCGHLT